MKTIYAFAFGFVLASSAVAQDQIVTTPLFDENVLDLAPEVVRASAAIAPDGVLLRALDKVSGEVVDFDLEPSQTKQLGRIQVTLGECRYPSQNINGDAFAFLTIQNVGNSDPAFRGWMIASSPALNGLDHARYDVWPLRCKTPNAD